MTAVVFVSHLAPALAVFNAVIALGLLLLGLALSATWVWRHKRIGLAVLIALTLAGAIVRAEGGGAVNVPNPVYIPYCDGFWGYIDPMCWLAQ